MMKLSEIAEEYRKIDFSDLKKHLAVMMSRYGAEDVADLIIHVYVDFEESSTIYRRVCYKLHDLIHPENA